MSAKIPANASAPREFEVAVETEQLFARIIDIVSKNELLLRERFHYI
jgi:hypothetical protein